MSGEPIVVNVRSYSEETEGKLRILFLLEWAGEGVGSGRQGGVGGEGVDCSG